MVVVIADSSVYDPARALVVGGLAFLGGALGYTYLWRARHVPRGQRSPMVWGSISALCLIVPAVFNQATRFGLGLTWRLPVYATAVVAGLVALHKVWRREAP